MEDLYTPFRESFGLMPSGTGLVIYLVLAPFFSVFLYGIYLRLKTYGGMNAIRSLFNPRLINFSSLIKNVLLQVKLLWDRKSGIMHIMIMYGIFVLFLGTILIFIDDNILSLFKIKLLIGNYYLLYEFLLDFFGLLLIVGLIIAIKRRVGRSRLKRLRMKKEHLAILYILIFICLTGFIIEGFRLYLTSVHWSRYSFIGYLISEVVKTTIVEKTIIIVAYQSIWWIHALAAFSLLAVAPFTNILHTVLGALNASYMSIREPVLYIPATPFRLTEILDKIDIEIKVGFKKVVDLAPLQRLAIDACTDCGRCEEACPATASGTLLSPRNLVQKLRSVQQHLSSISEDLFNVGILNLEEIYACTTCGACFDSCPVMINPLEYILEARRAIASEGKLDRHVTRILSNLARTQNPYGLPRSYKEAAIKELKAIGAKTIDEYPEAEYIYWLGCMALYDERIHKVAKSLIKVMIKCGVSFAIIGPGENCTGDPARRIGEEGRFQELAYQNIGLLNKFSDRKILTHCPHCYNIFKNEYKDLGLSLKVIHHTELLNMLVNSGKLRLRNFVKLTLHDSCYLSRFNSIIKEPRMALRDAKLIDMKRHGRETFCCGGGGGNFWFEIKRIKKESIFRIEEAATTGAEVLVVECPFCLLMLEDAAKMVGLNKMQVLDIAEVFDLE